MTHRHATDVVSLVFGVMFAGFVLTWALHMNDVIDFDQVWLAGPAILIVAGALGLFAALRPSLADGRPSDPVEPSPEQPAEEGLG